MLRRKSLLALAAGSALATASSRESAATVTASLMQVPIAPDALTDDPNLANYKTFDLLAIVSGGEHWLFCDLRFPLSVGKFYIPPHDDDNRVSPLRFTTGTRFLQNDTFVDVPIFNVTNTMILGKSKYAPSSQIGEIFPSNGSNLSDPSDGNGTAFLPANDLMLVDAAWGFPVSNTVISHGTFTVARLTMTLDAAGSMLGRFGVQEHINSPTTFNLAVAVPEPTSVAVIAAGMGAFALRRRRDEKS